MRYRPLGHSGLALSCVGLLINPEQCRRQKKLLQELIETALEHGINAYYFKSLDLAVMREAASILSVVDRNIIFVGALAHDVQAGLSGFSYEFAPMKERLRWAIKDTGFDYLDFLTLDHPTQNLVPDDTMAFLMSLRRAKMVRRLCAIGETGDFPDLWQTADYHAITTTLNMDSDWAKRNAITQSLSLDINIFCENYFPDYLKDPHQHIKSERVGGFLGMGGHINPLINTGTYAFLYQTPEWSAEELCLAYVLAEPNISSVWIAPENARHLIGLAEVPERELPPSVPAQIEMARFNNKSNNPAEFPQKKLF